VRVVPHYLAYTRSSEMTPTRTQVSTRTNAAGGQNGTLGTFKMGHWEQSRDSRLMRRRASFVECACQRAAIEDDPFT
jgi:hypothetical protein